MELVIEKKFLEGVWWKWPIGLFLLQFLLWVLLTLKIATVRLPFFTVAWFLLRDGVYIYGAFLASAFLPFIAGRLQLKSLYWATLIGYALANLAYALLAMNEAVRRANLIPISAYMQLYATCFCIGAVIEFGKYVYRKVTR